MKHTGTILLHIIISLLLCLPYTGYSQCQAAKEIEACGTFDDWTVREIKESGIIGGKVKYSYEIAKGDTIKGAVPYVNPPHCVWSTSSVMANVSGIVKVSCTVFPEERGDGNCVRLETRLEKI